MSGTRSGDDARTPRRPVTPSPLGRAAPTGATPTSAKAGAPVLICPQFVATARSAIVVSSVSPERWLIMQRSPLR